MPQLPAINQNIEGYLNSFPAYTSLSGEAKDWFYWTNYSRNNPRAFYDSVVAPVLNTFPNLKSAYSNSLKRDLYSAKQLPMVKPVPDLLRLAQSHADQLKLAKSPPSHTSPAGATFQARMKMAQVNRCAGENISFGPLNTVLALVLLYIDENIPELGHRKTLLSSDYVEMGVGISTYPNGYSMVVQDFACGR